VKDPQKKRNWKEFDLDPPPTRTGFYASINHTGRIAINRRIWRDLGSPEAVSILYEPDDEAIGIRPTERIMPNAFPVVPISRGKRFWIRAQRFMERAEIKLSRCIRFTDPHIEDGVLVLDLHHTAPADSPRARKN
jgi:hypothetical protein